MGLTTLSLTPVLALSLVPQVTNLTASDARSDQFASFRGTCCASNP